MSRLDPGAFSLAGLADQRHAETPWRLGALRFSAKARLRVGVIRCRS